MPGPRGVIKVNGNTERSLQTEEHTAALAAEVQSGLLKQHYNPAVEPLDTIDTSPSYLLFQTLLPLFWTLTCMI